MTAPRYRGLTWDHPRGRHALEAAARTVAPEHGLAIDWEVHPLEGFESSPIEALAERYDLIVLDHPHLGDALEANCLIPMEQVIDAAALAEIEDDAIGASLTSYRLNDRVWALPLDAATQISAYRPDRIDKPPADWDAVLALMDRAAVTVPLGGPHALMTFMSLCLSLGAQPANDEEGYCAPPKTAREALGMLRRIVGTMHPDGRQANPIAVYQAMSQADGPVYAPLIYGYVNYARPAEGAAPIRFADAPVVAGVDLPGSVLGGTGLAVSRRATLTPALARHIAWLLSADTQRDFIPAHDGQPSRRAAWHDGEVNAQWGDFYADTARTLEAAWVRPRYAGYVHQQTAASQAIREGLLAGTDDTAIIDAVARAMAR
jgi:multiple sugar transport system substrate-binding protein